MWLNYDAQSPQRPTALLTLERRLRGRPLVDRVKLVCWLKTRTCRSFRGTAALLGDRARQRQRWWATYRTAGLEALRQQPARLGRRARVREEAWTGLAGELQAGRVARLQDA